MEFSNLIHNTYDNDDDGDNNDHSADVPVFTIKKSVYEISASLRG